MKNKKYSRSSSQIKRCTFRIPKSLYDDLHYQAHQDGRSVSSLIQIASQFYLDWRHHDMPIPSLDRQRINQLTDGLQAINNTLSTKLDEALNMDATILSFTHGTNYLNNHKNEY